VDRIVATARYAGHLVARELISNCGMHRISFTRVSTGVAVQAFAIVVGLMELDIFWARRRAEILNVNVAQASELGASAAIEAIVSVAGVASFVRGNAMVLKMGGRNVGRIVDVKAFTVGLHDVAGKAKLRLLGTFDVGGGCHGAAQNRQHAKGNEGQHLSRGGNCYRRTEDDDRDENRRDDEQGVQQGFRRWQIQCNVLAKLSTR